MCKFILILASFTLSITSISQGIPQTETTFTIHKNEKQQFHFSIKRGYVLRAMLVQQGIDLAIGVYKKNDPNRIILFDAPNGENGPEPIHFECPADGEYYLEVQELDGGSVTEGKYTIKLISVKPLGAAMDTAFANGSGIRISQPDKLTIKNLANLGMVWGFLKYHLPANANGDFNWDAQLFRITPAIIAARTKADASLALEKWIDGLGKPEACQSCEKILKDSLVKMMPDYGDIFASENLSPSLVKKLTYIKDNRSQGENYWISLYPDVGNPVFQHENPYPKMVYPDAGYRLLALFRYWNMIQYFYPYKYLIGKDWNLILPEFIPKFLNAKDSTRYVLTCLELIASIHDTHANIWSSNALTAYFGRNQVPVQGNFIENELVVTNYYSDTLSIRDKLKIGDIITRINGRSVKEWVGAVLYLTPASNLSAQLRSLPGRTLLRSNKQSIDLEIIRNNEKKSVSVPCIDAARINQRLDYDPAPKDSSYRIIDGNIGYLFAGRYQNSQLERIETAFKNTRGMIIDMRTYPSNFMPFSFGAHIKPASSPFVKFTSGSISNPGLFVFGPALNNGESNPSYYKGPIVELVNSLSVSQSEYTTMAFQTAPDCAVIGSMTAGADGNISQIALPGGIYTLISGIGVYYPNGDETQRVGIRIDMQVNPTIEGIRKGRDELLEKAIEIINQKNNQKQ